LGVRPGPVIGKTLYELRDAQLNGEIVTVDEARAWVARRTGAS
jgi:hypothetical protein